MKRFWGDMSREKLTSLAQTIALLSKQSIKAIHPNSFAIEKTCFSKNGVRPVLDSAWLAVGRLLRRKYGDGALLSLRHNFLDQLRIIRQQTRFG